jgi:hypothetical protein
MATKVYHVILRIEQDETAPAPDQWDWPVLIDSGGDSDVSLMLCEEIDEGG